MGIMNEEYIKENKRKVIEGIETKGERTLRPFCQLIGSRTSDKDVLEAIYKRGITEEMIKEQADYNREMHISLGMNPPVNRFYPEPYEGKEEK